MCGIFVSARIADTKLSMEEHDINEALAAACDLRGPDNQGAVSLSFGNAGVRFYATELRLRGTSTIVQPHCDAAGNILCWNGEVFDGIQVHEHENDGAKLLIALAATKTQEDFIQIFAGLEGPYAVVYYQAASRLVYFARDCLGRRSLLVHYPSPELPCFLLASVSAGANYPHRMIEVDTAYIYCLDVGAWAGHLEKPRSLAQHIISLSRKPKLGNGPYAEAASVNRELPPTDLPIWQSLDQASEVFDSAIGHCIFHLDRSVRLRVQNIPPTPTQARLAVLFSGGIDCTALAYLAHKHLPLDEPIDLLNVAFENPRKARAHAASKAKHIDRPAAEIVGSAARPDTAHNSSPYLVPDRISGLSEVAELRRLCPGRTWNFVEINVPFAECQSAQTTVETLMHPRNTVMDLSLANALYFASRGVGHIHCEAGEDALPYTSPARVLLSGLGSDELLGGYGRHRTTFKCGSWPALIDELQSEIDRIPMRNLGRDDRVISTHGKECRYPFLSLDFVSFAAGLPVHMKTDPRAEPGVGDKLLLRLMMWKLGLFEASARHKKAMQFGSHSARMLGGSGDKKGHLAIE